MGLVTKDDGWRISDELWSKMDSRKNLFSMARI